jgi:hypothetical protein
MMLTPEAGLLPAGVVFWALHQALFPGVAMNVNLRTLAPSDLEIQVPARTFIVVRENSGIGKAAATKIAR